MAKRNKQQVEKLATEEETEERVTKEVEKMIHRFSLPFAADVLGIELTPKARKDAARTISEYWGKAIMFSLEGAAFTWLDQYDEEEEEEEKQDAEIKQFPKSV